MTFDDQLGTITLKISHIEQEVDMTWLELYNFLHEKANDVKNLDSELWQSEVVIHDATTGDEAAVDTWEIDGETRLAYNIDAV